MMNNEPSITEYMCSWCGKRVQRTRGEGRPLPGECPRRPKNRDGQLKPHTWIINKVFK